jgi:glycosyltransferase involved in cell wall biosynthesis
MTPSDLSIIIPSYRSQDTLRICLNALTDQSGRVSHEIIVIDSSPDEVVERICQDYAGVVCVRLKNKTLPGIARNIGADNASGETLVFLDADVFLEADALLRVLEYSRQGYKIFGGALDIASGSCVPWGIIEHYYFNHEAHRRRGVCRRKNLSSALLVVDRRLFNEVGGFEDIPRMQDTELTERISCQGTPLYFFPDVRGQQLQTATFTGLCKKVAINGNNLFFIRYSNGITPLKRMFFSIGLPLLTFIKMTRINVRNFVYQGWSGRLIAILLCPAIYFLGLFWMMGFYKALLSKDGMSHAR